MIQDRFEQLTQQEVVRLRKQFTREVESASNPDYAKKYFRYRLFEKCVDLPYQTVFLNELIKVFYHFSQLNESQAASKTLEHIPRVRQRSYAVSEFTMDILLQIKVAMNTEEKHYFDSLPDCYQDHILFEGSTIESLHDFEKEVCGYSDEKILSMLATYKASKLLDAEFFPVEIFNDVTVKEPQEADHKNLSTGTNKRPGLTRLQQVIMFKKICKLSNIDESNCNASDFAFVLFNFVGIRTEIGGSDTYKMILDPYKFCTLEGMIRNLQVVRSMFEYLNNPKPIQMINQEIAEIEKKIKKSKIQK